jgi:zinc-binding in reverse transcriptase
VHSLYKFLNSGGIHVSLCRSIWKLPIPLKVKLFVSLALRNRILTRDNLLWRGWVGPNECPFCCCPETVDHLFFLCHLSQQIWHLLCSFSPINNLLPVNSLNDYWNTCLKLPLQDMILWGSVLAAALWSLWNIRNNIIFRNATLLPISSVHFSILHLVSFWIGTNVVNFRYSSSAGLADQQGQTRVTGPMDSRDLSSDQFSDEDLLE